MDDISATPYLGIPLSSLHSDMEQVAGQIAELIFKRMENRYYRERSRIDIPFKVVVRESLRKMN